MKRTEGLNQVLFTAGFVAILILVVVILRNAFGEDAGTVTTQNAELAKGDEAPDFSVELLSGDTFTLSEHRGKVVFLNFWATWCSPCVAEMPAIQELSEEYEADAVFIGVNVAEASAKVEDFIEDGGYTYDIGMDETADIRRELYPGDSIPYTVVINGDGIISEIFIGGGSQMHGIFEEAIKKALSS